MASMHVPDTITILAIDPGLNNIGIAVITHSYITKNILNITVHTLKPEHHITHDHYLAPYTDTRSIKLQIINDHLQNILALYPIDIVVCEAAFFYGNKPNAFKALVESITTIRQTIISFNPRIPFLQLEPLLVKKHVKSLNIHNKTSTKDALMALNINTFIDLNGLDEHSVDAISIGYAFLESRELLI